PMRDADKESFTAYHAIPIRHAMTLGELASMFNSERSLGADLRIVRMEGWKRGAFFDGTGLTWIPPSPNLRTPDAALLYPGIALFEATNVSVGRGTDRPFGLVGAPWIDGKRLAAALTDAQIAGLTFTMARFTPSESTYAGIACEGVAIDIASRERFEPVRAGIG